MRRCYFSKNYTNTNSAGNKAKTDIESIMSNAGFVNVGLPQTICKNKVFGFILTLAGVIKAIFCIQKGDLLLMQYPLKKYYSFLCKIAHLKGAKVITLVHDLGSFRRKRLTKDEEKRRISKTDYIIALNPIERDWFIKENYKQPIGVLEVWDYISEAKPQERKFLSDNTFRIMHAGSTSIKQHSFIYKLDKSLSDNSKLQFDMYGNNFEENSIIHKGLYSAKGFKSPDDIIKTHQSDFGLIWYGHSINEIDGAHGEYMQITTPHKPSLYIRCHIPIILWEKMAITPFIKEHNIGLSINSLDELEPLLTSISKEQYQEMKDNITKLSAKIAKGDFFINSFEKAEKELSNSYQ